MNIEIDIVEWFSEIDLFLRVKVISFYIRDDAGKSMSTVCDKKGIFHEMNDKLELFGLLNE